ncbi:helix-turn-helix transcriptional regulator [Roseofilum reptotaenium CS-1145]|uniref:Transcriptional regulator n=1 Tax=Roseofilum reptotaenium AO1-A TaxID=1925591 RepID=A0A1L9QQN6_9CYAN|nr:MULTISPECIES: helix-turn-helix transcriptional regulator [Roseofilum]MBP0028746.1 helix-turn-helix transcriptional regulator [Roseofilum sp. Guam]MDB9516214.1 helix-turn-helix transcriptional regulator [Roseofilum reptotaenium CS-1145]OJJ24942.1 transcriptional regulator [Roseofilum reptotaenium AO1-A]
MTTETFGKILRRARKDKGYSQRSLAALVKLDFTYLSKLENDRADYPPKEDVIRSLAKHLDLEPDMLVCLAGRIPHQYEELLKQNAQAMPMLLRRLRENPDFAEKIFQAANEDAPS